jgi:hypothetical protein
MGLENMCMYQSRRYTHTYSTNGIICLRLLEPHILFVLIALALAIRLISCGKGVNFGQSGAKSPLILTFIP